MKTDERTVVNYKGESQPVSGRIFLCSLGFAAFEWIIIQVFRDNIGYSNWEAWGIGFGIYFLYLYLAVKFRRDIIDSLFV